MVLARVLVLLGVILAVASVVAGYVRYQALDTPTVANTANELIADDEIRNQVAATLVEQLFANVDAQAELEARLPPDQKPSPSRSPRRCASSQTGRLSGCSPDRGSKPCGRPRSSELTSSLFGCSTTISRAISTEDGAVVLDLQPLVIQLGDQVAVFGSLAQNLPEDAGRVEVLQADQLQTAQDLTQLLKQLALFLWLVPLALFAISLWLAHGRRRVDPADDRHRPHGGGPARPPRPQARG